MALPSSQLLRTAVRVDGPRIDLVIGEQVRENVRVGRIDASVEHYGSHFEAEMFADSGAGTVMAISIGNFTP
jgi:hypothetical protein